MSHQSLYFFHRSKTDQNHIQWEHKRQNIRLVKIQKSLNDCSGGTFLPVGTELQDDL